MSASPDPANRPAGAGAAASSVSRAAVLSLFLLSIVLSSALSLGAGYLLWGRGDTPGPAAPPGAKGPPSDPNGKTPDGKRPDAPKPSFKSLAVLPVKSHMSLADSFSGKLREFEASLPEQIEKATGARVVAIKHLGPETPWKIGQKLKVDGVLAMDLVIDGSNITDVECRLLSVESGLPVWQGKAPVVKGSIAKWPEEIVGAVRPWMKAAEKEAKVAGEVSEALRASMEADLAQKVFIKRFVTFVPGKSSYDKDAFSLHWLLDVQEDIPYYYERDYVKKHRLNFQDADGVSILTETVADLARFDPPLATLKKGNRVRVQLHVPRIDYKRVARVVVEPAD